MSRYLGGRQESTGREILIPKSRLTFTNHDRSPDICVVFLPLLKKTSRASAVTFYVINLPAVSEIAYIRVYAVSTIWVGSFALKGYPNSSVEPNHVSMKARTVESM